MTNDEVRTAIAGVLGWEVANGYRFVDRQVPCPDGNAGCGVVHWGKVPERLSDWPNDINACFRDLVPFMRRSDPKADLTLTGDGSGGWWAHWQWHDEGEFRYDRGYAKEPALAVCIATLAAVGIDAEAEAVQA